jgi:hypothetical protein
MDGQYAAGANEQRRTVESEPLMIRFMSRVSGNVYDEVTVDHMADMVLIMYSGGGTAVGAVIGGCLGSYIVAHHPSLFHVLTTVPLLGFLGAVAGALLTMWFLNVRGLIAWDRYEFRRIYKLKS